MNPLRDFRLALSPRYGDIDADGPRLSRSLAQLAERPHVAWFIGLENAGNPHADCQADDETYLRRCEGVPEPVVPQEAARDGRASS